MQWTAKREAIKRDAIQQFLGAVSKSSVSSVAKTSAVVKIALIVVSILIVNSGTVVRSIRGCRLLCCPGRPGSHRKKEFFWAFPGPSPQPPKSPVAYQIPFVPLRMSYP